METEPNVRKVDTVVKLDAVSLILIKNIIKLVRNLVNPIKDVT